MLFPRLAEPRDRLALRVLERWLTERELARACAGVVELLEEKGIGVGDVVAVYTQPAIETAVALVACVLSGRVAVPIDPKLGTTELAHVLTDAAPAIALAADPEPMRGPDRPTTLAIPMRAGEVRVLRHPPLTHASASLVLYTSGTTGAPKGALLSSANLAADLDALADAWAWTEADTIVHALPLFHVHGLVLGLFGALRRGGALSWVPRFTPEDVVRAMDAEASPVLFAVPTMHHRIAEAAEHDAMVCASLSRARLLVSGSAALPAREHGRIERLTGQRIVERYGSTETLIVCAVRSDGDRRAGIVGPPVAGTELRLLDENGAPIPSPTPETLGEIAVRGPTVFLGYLKRPDATAAVLDREGFFHTGDIGSIEADGAIRIAGRKSTDLIKCGGFKVGAGEVEGALLEHPAVREAAVVGAPDVDLGERIVAFVVLSGSAAPKELEDHVAKLLSPHKRPRDIRPVASLPRNAMGKVQKKELARLLLEDEG